ncbi:zinc finger MYM-type protein 1-like isoform X2, partial [Aphis craccivora]
RPCESLNDFVELLPFVIKTLENISPTWGAPSSVDAEVLLKSALDSESLKEIRENSEKEFQILFEKIKNLADVIGTEISKKRTARKQINRANPQVYSVEEYYRVTVFVPLSQNSNHLSFTDEERLAFEKLVIEKDNSFVELKIWKVKISNGDVNTKTGLEALLNCSKRDFPNIHFLIKIFCTLPVSTATPERSFSTLKG